MSCGWYIYEDMLSDISNPIYNMFTVNGLIQHVKSSTHDSSTLIDHVYTSHMLNNMINTEVLDSDLIL